MNRLASRILPPLVLVAVVLGAWELWIWLADVDPAVFSAPSDVAAALVDQAGTLVGHIGTTMAETGIGLVAGALLGLVTAIVIATWPLAKRALEPPLVVLQTIPPIVLAPILVLALGFGWAPRIVVVIIVVFFPVAIAAAGAFMATDQARLDLVRSFGASRWQAIRTVTLPGSLPAIFDGLRISAAYAVGAAAIAEQLGGAYGGVGLFIARSQRQSLADQVLAGVVVIAVLSLAVYALVGWAARRLTPWNQPASEPK